MIRNGFLLAILLLGVAGCAGPASKKRPAKASGAPSGGITQTINAFSLDQARQLQQRHEYHLATVEYRKIIESVEAAPEDKALAKIGAAQCLMATHNFPAALALLVPLPLPAESPVERRILALAGEILLHLQRTAEAEKLLEQALPPDALPKDESQPWMAPACANLGYAYLQNRKPKPAQEMYCRAAELFVLAKDMNSARTATDTAQEIAPVIETHAAE